MEKKNILNINVLFQIALVAGGFAAGAAIWGPLNSSLQSKEPNKISHTEQTVKPAGLALTAADKEIIGKTAAEYLIAHPENLVEAGKRLEANRDGEKTSDVVNTKDVLLESKFTPNYGPDNADVAVIEFFDYMCHFCQQSSPVLEKAIAQNKNVRTFFKDFTIFADRTPISGMGAKIGLYIFNKYGQEKYYEFHNKLMSEAGMATKARKDYTPANLATMLHGLGYKEILDEQGNFLLASELRDNLQNILDANMMLADKLNYSGTPVFIVMNIKNPQNQTTSIMPGAPDLYRLQQAIDKAKGY